MLLENANLLHDEEQHSWLLEDSDPSSEALAWEIHQETIEQLTEVEKQLLERGITPKVGLELEIPQGDLETDVKKVEVARGRLINEATFRFSPSVLVDSEIAFLKTATCLELILYQLFQSEVGAVLNRKFVESFDSSILYDARGVIEIQTVPLNVGELAPVREKILGEMKRIASELGLLGADMDDAPNYHINLSFFDADGNVFSSDHPKFLTTGKTLAEAVSYSLRKSLFFLFSYIVIPSANLLLPNLGTSRQSGFRFDNGRIEVKFSNWNAREQNVEMVTLLALAGAVYGLDSRDQQSDIQPAEVVYSPQTICADKALKIFCKLLHDCYINADGSLVIKKQYVNFSYEKLLFELGISDKRPEDSAITQLVRSFIKPREFDALLQFLENIRIQKTIDGFQLVFPEEENGECLFVIPEVGMSLLPIHLREQIRGGTELTPKQINKHILAGQRIPKAEIRKKIDTKRLREKIVITNMNPKFMISDPANSSHTSESETQVLQRRHADFLSNNSLCYLGDDFRGRLQQIIGQFVDRRFKTCE